MQKIMFNKPYGLQHAVECGYKTMTRRPVGKRMTEDDIRAYLKGYTELANKCAQYKIGEVVAVAQSYKDAGIDPHFLMFQPIKGSTYFAEMEIEAMFTGGWNNKMFVRADLMPLKIQITDIKMERLQDISDEDCLKEGIYVSDTFTKYGIRNGYSPQCTKDPKEKKWWFGSPREAFAALIDKLSGKGTWNRNDWQFAYTFKLVK